MDTELIIVMVLGVGVIVGLGVALFLQRRKESDDDSTPPPRSRNLTPPPSSAKVEAGSKKQEGVATQGAEDLMREGKFEEAARLAMRNKNWNEAKDYYIEAGQLGNAAHCAHRAGKLEEAADLYEQADDIENAAKIWEKVGDHEHARELRKLMMEARSTARDEPSGEGADADDSGRLRAVPTTKQKKQLQEAEEAGDWKTVATIAEEAGMNEDAAQAWVKHARRTKSPSEYLDRIERLSPTVAHRFMELEAKAHPPAASTAHLHYRLACSYARLAVPSEGIYVLEKLLRAVKDHAEAKQLIEELRENPYRHVPLLADEAVQQAKKGPSIQEMEGMIAGAECDLTNIEVYYRLGLAFLAEERWSDAKEHFATVQATSPGYRDAAERLKLLGMLESA